MYIKNLELFWLHDALNLHETTEHVKTSRTWYCESCGAILRLMPNTSRYQPAGIIDFTYEKLLTDTGLSISKEKFEIGRQISIAYKAARDKA